MVILEASGLCLCVGSSLAEMWVIHSLLLTLLPFSFGKAVLESMVELLPWRIVDQHLAACCKSQCQGNCRATHCVWSMLRQSYGHPWQAGGLLLATQRATYCTMGLMLGNPQAHPLQDDSMLGNP